MDRRIVLAFVFVLLAVAALAWPEYSRYRHDPERYKQAQGSGVDITEVTLFASEHADFAYDQSPLVTYLEVEKAHIDFDDAEILATADRIAEEVAWKMLFFTGTHDVVEAEQMMWQWRAEKLGANDGITALPDDPARKIAEWIANRIEYERIIYGPEALLSRSFDTDQMVGGYFHMDCDQLSHFFLHVAWRLDLDIREVSSPKHTYLAYVGPADVPGEPVTIEATEFRRTVERNGSVDMAGHGIGEMFFMHPDHHKRYGRTRAVPELVDRAGYYQYRTDADIADVIVAEVTRGISAMNHLDNTDPLADEAARAARRASFEQILATMEDELPQSHEPGLVTNTWLAHVRAGRAAMSDGDPATALRHGVRAGEIREAFGVLVIYTEPIEEVLEARARYALGETQDALVALEALYEEYGGDAALDYRTVAQSHAHAEVLIHLARAGRRSRVDRYNYLVLPVLNFELKAGGYRNAAREKEALSLCASLMRGLDNARAQECAELAE